ncbi:hypothetical protein K6L44_16990, partial [Gluconacetobacter entanii]|nr:hypothetical protein [Gluconacetobacter entanii]MCW4578844.1 hypothetical protein [Gluconacetobacter entanii]
MTTNYYFSASTNAFYLASLRAQYATAGTWPADAVAVTDDTFATYGIATPPAGQARGVASDGTPTWIAAPTPAVPLKTQASNALAQAQQTVWAEYGSLGQAVPAAWV